MVLPVRERASEKGIQKIHLGEPQALVNWSNRSTPPCDIPDQCDEGTCRSETCLIRPFGSTHTPDTSRGRPGVPQTSRGLSTHSRILAPPSQRGLRKPYFVRLERKQYKVRGQRCWVSARVYTGFHRADIAASCPPPEGAPVTALWVRQGLSQGQGQFGWGHSGGSHWNSRWLKAVPAIAHDRHTPAQGGLTHPLPASVSSPIKWEN